MDLDAIRDARATQAGVAVRTPTVASPRLSARTGATVMLKAENLQRTGSFKIRGALNKLAALSGSTSTVTTGSAGNHALALALAARHHGLGCEIFVPQGAAISKIDGARAFGATVIEQGASLVEAVAAAQEFAAAGEAVFCHPFDDPAVIAGQGTLGLELVEDVAGLTTVVIPLGGGGLASGTAIAVKSLDPTIRVIGVQAAVCAPYLGHQVPTGPISTLADGIAVKSPGEFTGPLVARWLDELVSVDEDSIADAMVLLMEHSKLYVEGAGAVGVAALLGGAITVAPDEVVAVVLSGGNVDLGVVPGLIRRHETQSGRRLAVFAHIDDRPGGLARLLTVFADAGANLIEVEHVREGIDLHVRETGVHLTFEVRSRDHAEAVVAMAENAGYVLRLADR